MTSDRDHATEDEYFRNQELERREEEAWQLQQKTRAEEVEREARDARRARQASRNASLMRDAPSGAHRGLNRLIIAGCGEILTLSEAILIVQVSRQRESLVGKAERREVFRRDLSAAVIALGGVPASSASLRARGRAWMRSLRRLLTGPHGGDAYAACAHAAESSAREYTRVLDLSLPSDIRFGVERQYVEVERDCRELRRLRWGASPASDAR